MCPTGMIPALMKTMDMSRSLTLSMTDQQNWMLFALAKSATTILVLIFGLTSRIAFYACIIFDSFLETWMMLNPFLASLLVKSSPIPSDDPVMRAHEFLPSNRSMQSTGQVTQCCLRKLVEQYIQPISLIRPTNRIRYTNGPAFSASQSRVSVTCIDTLVAVLNKILYFIISIHQLDI